MNAFDAKRAIKNVSSYSVTIICFVFVTWQSFKCITKYLNAPKGTQSSLQNIAATHTFPAITICKHEAFYEPYNSDQLKKCGLR